MHLINAVDKRHSMQKTIVRFILTLALLAFAPLTHAQAHSGPPGFADLAEKLLPAVVNISTSQTITAKEDMMDLPPDMQLPPGSPFEQFFKDFMNKQKGGGAHKHKETA